MLGVRSVTLPFLLLCKLCGEYEGDDDGPYEPDSGVASDAGMADDGSAAGDAQQQSDADLADASTPDAGEGTDADVASDGGEPPDANAESDADAADGSADLDAASDGSVDMDAETSDGQVPEGGVELDARLPDATADSGGTAGDGSVEPDASAAPDGGAPDAGPVVLRDGPPGLYLNVATEELAPGLRPYAPRFALWADGSDKERFVALPEGATIDASDPDLWRYPVGTRFFKTFSLAGQKLETRIIEKIAPGFGVAAWTFRAYAWRADQQSVELVPDDGRLNVLGTEHDIPSVGQCRMCHVNGGQDAINGFAAIQLNYALAGVTLQELLEQGSLVSPQADSLLEAAVVPGDERAQAALGYLHANCGNCHGGPNPRAGMNLRLVVGQREVELSTPYLSAVGQPLRNWVGRSLPNGVPIVLRIVPGSAALSAIVVRMGIRAPREQMPSIGTEIPDPDGIAAVSAWIDAL